MQRERYRHEPVRSDALWYEKRITSEMRAAVCYLCVIPARERNNAQRRTVASLLLVSHSKLQHGVQRAARLGHENKKYI
jgi:hypothetical protein